MGGVVAHTSAVAQRLPLVYRHFVGLQTEKGGRGKCRCLPWLENRLWPANILVGLAQCAAAGGVRAQGTVEPPPSKHAELVPCSQLSQQRFPFRGVLMHVEVVLDQSHIGSKSLTLNCVCTAEKKAFEECGCVRVMSALTLRGGGWGKQKQNCSLGLP